MQSDHLSFGLALFSLAALVGCSSDHAEPGYDTRGFQGDVQLDSCTGDAAPELVRCGGDAAPGIIAAVCGDLEADNTVTVNGGSLAVTGRARLASPLHVTGGSFTGFSGIQGDNTQDVTGDLATSGDWIVSSPAHIGGDAFVGGTLDAKNDVDIGGVLHAAPADMMNINAAEVAAPTNVTNPLHCEAAPAPSATISRLEKGDFVDERYALSSHTHAARVQLGCATYRFDSFGIDSDLTLHVKGHTVIAVDGDVRVASPVIVELEPGAQLDFLIGGSLQVDNRLSFSGGSTWLAVGGALRIAAPMQLEGYLYAPQSAFSSTRVAADNTLDVTGRLLVDSLRAASPVNVNASADPELPACRPSEQQ